jgi:hypothetical protein
MVCLKKLIPKMIEETIPKFPQLYKTPQENRNLHLNIKKSDKCKFLHNFSFTCDDDFCSRQKAIVQ